MAAVYTSGSELIQQPLPGLFYGKNTTISDSRQRLWFCGKMATWNGFSDRVRQTVDKANLNDRNVLSIRQGDLANNPNCASIEQCQSGDELSVSGRFTQNALLPTTCVARDRGFYVRFGDFKISDEGKDTPESSVATRNLPDFAAIQDKDRQSGKDMVKPILKFIGEAKTPWVKEHNLSNKLKQDWGQRGLTSLRKSLGQVAAYMFDYKRKYAFLTTYEQTIFLKQELDNPAKQSSESTLYISDVIYSSNTPLNNKGRDVSLRECLLYFVMLTIGAREPDYLAESRMKRQDWVQSQSLDDPQGFVSPDKNPAQQNLIDLRSPVNQPSASMTDDSVEVGVDWATDMCTGTFRFPLNEVQDPSRRPYITINGRRQFLKLTRPQVSSSSTLQEAGGLRPPARKERSVSPSSRAQGSLRPESRARATKHGSSSASDTEQVGSEFRDLSLRQGEPGPPGSGPWRPKQGDSSQRPPVSSRKSSNSGSEGSYRQGPMQQDPSDQRQLRSTTRRQQQQQANPPGQSSRQAGDQGGQGGKGKEKGKGASGGLKGLFTPKKDKSSGGGKGKDPI